MTTDVRERLKQIANGNGQAPSSEEDLKKQPSNVPVSVLVPSEATNAPMSALHLPDLKPVTNDRAGKRMLQEAQRDMGRVVYQTVKTGMTIESIRKVNTHVVYAVDQGQEEMMQLLYSHARHEGMNEMLGEVIGQRLQHMLAQMAAISEAHFKRLMEMM